MDEKLWICVCPWAGIVGFNIIHFVIETWLLGFFVVFLFFLKDVVIDRSNAQYISWLEKKISSFSFLGFQQHIKLLVVQKKQHKTCFKSQESYPLIKNHTLLLFLLLKDLSNYWMDYNDLIMVIDANDFSDPHTFHTLCFFWLWVTFFGGYFRRKHDCFEVPYLTEIDAFSWW